MVTPTPRRRGVTSLAAASLVTGLLAYVFFAVAARALGAGPAAPVSVLWTWWGLTGAAVTFPLQHWLARTAVATGGERAARAALPRLITLTAAVAVGAGLIAWVARQRLFGESGASFPGLVTLVTAGAGLLGVVRGQLTARDRLGSVGASLVAENAIRCAASIALALAGVGDPRAYGAALALGYATAAFFPDALRWRETGEIAADQRSVLNVGTAGAGQLLAQVALTGSPVVLALAGGRPAAVTSLFAALALLRAPYTVATGLMAALTARVTRMWLAADARQWRRPALILAGAGVLGLASATPGAALIGPWVVRLVFGADIELTGPITALLAAGSVLALVNLVLAVVLVAAHRGTALVLGWAAAFVVGAVWFTVSGLTDQARVGSLFVVVEAAAVAALGAAAWSGVRRQAAPPGASGPV